MDDSDLIQHDDSIARKGLRRLAAGVSVAVFVGVLVGAGVIDVVWPAERPQLEGKEKEAEERSRRRARFSDGSLARWVERELRVRSRVRSVVLPDYSFLLYFYLGESTASSLVGRSGWVFIENRVLVNQMPRPRLFGRIAGIFRALERRLETTGTRLVLSVIPRKSVVEEGHLPRGADPHSEIYPELIEDLESRGLIAPDLLSAYRAEGDEHFYRRVESHWNDRGKIVGAEVVARAGGFLVPKADRHGSLVEIGVDNKNRDIFRFMGIDPEPWQEELVEDYGSRKTRLKGAEGHSLPALEPFAEKMTRIALVGTSFTEKSRFPDFLSHFAGEEIWFGALRGTGPVGPLVRSLEEMREKGMPEVLVWEVPAHSLVSSRGLSLREHRRSPLPLPGIGRAFAMAPYRDGRVLASFFGDDTKGEEPGGHSLEKGKQEIGQEPGVATLDSGSLFFSGDGALSVRIKGAVAGSPVTVRVLAGSEEVSSGWNPGEKNLVLPVLGEGLMSRVVTEISCEECSATVKLRSMDLVTDLTTERPVLSESTPLKQGDEGWSQGVEFKEAVGLERFEALRVHIRTPPESVGPVQVGLLLEGGSPSIRRYLLKGAGPEVTAIISGWKIGGERVKEVQISGNGQVSKGGSIAVSVLSTEPLEASGDRAVE